MMNASSGHSGGIERRGVKRYKFRLGYSARGVQKEVWIFYLFRPNKTIAQSISHVIIRCEGFTPDFDPAFAWTHLGNNFHLSGQVLWPVKYPTCSAKLWESR